MLYLLIPAAWFAVVLFGLTMFRLAALSDRARARAVTRWVATSPLAEPEVVRRERPAEQLALEHGLHSRRAAG